MAKKKKVKLRKDRIVIVIILFIVLVGFIYFNTRRELQVITVVSTIESYDYILESNATRLFKKYYKELDEEIKDNKIDEDNYASLVAKLFVIDYYTLDNKITNKNIGGVQFIHSNLKDKFISESSNTIYKYVKSNLYGSRRQKLPEVNNVEIVSINNIKYSNGNYVDDNGYEVIVNIGYVRDYDYPEKVSLKLIHEDMKLSIVEVK